jgi:hypothetical protein
MSDDVEANLESPADFHLSRQARCLRPLTTLFFEYASTQSTGEASE